MTIGHSRPPTRYAVVAQLLDVIGDAANVIFAVSASGKLCRAVADAAVEDVLRSAGSSPAARCHAIGQLQQFVFDIGPDIFRGFCEYTWLRLALPAFFIQPGRIGISEFDPADHVMVQPLPGR